MIASNADPTAVLMLTLGVREERRVHSGRLDDLRRRQRRYQRWARLRKLLG